MTEFPRSCIGGIGPCSGSGYALPGQSRCSAHSSAKSGWAKYAKAHPSRAQVYASPRWREVRGTILQRDPDCTLRLPGCTGRSTEVDHIRRPADGGTDDPDNLRGVCRRCHRRRTVEQSKLGNKKAAARRRQRD